MITVLNTDYLIENSDPPDSDVIITVPAFECPVGTTMIAVVITLIADSSSPAVSRVVYNGNGLYLAVEGQNGTRYGGIYYFQNPEAVTEDIEIITTGDTYGRRIAVYALSGTLTLGALDQTAIYNSYVSEGIGTDITPTVNGCIILDGVICGDGADMIGFETVVFADESGTYNNGNVSGSQYHIQPTAGTKTMSWGWTGESEAVHVLASFQPEPSAPIGGGFFNYFYQ